MQEAYQAVTGATGEPGDWHGAGPIKKALTAAEARVAELEGLVHAVGPLVELYGNLCADPDGMTDAELVQRIEPMMFHLARAFSPCAARLLQPKPAPAAGISEDEQRARSQALSDARRQEAEQRERAAGLDTKELGGDG